MRSGTWQSIEIPFDSPRVGTRNYRIVFEANAVSDEATTVWVDDLALIEWQAPFYSSKNAGEVTVPIETSHIQVEAQAQ